MKPVARWIVMFVLACGFTASAAAETDPDSPAARLAERYGLSGWDQIETIEFTFNVQPPDPNRMVVRRWRWEVKNQRVKALDLVGDSWLNLNQIDPVDPEGDADRMLHREFINDSYWLFFPFQLVWSDPTVDVQIADQGYPIPTNGLSGYPAIVKLVCQWPAEGGYTPGDAYDLYLDEDGLIRQWVFRRGGGEKGRAMTWEDHQHLGPILVSLDHRNADGTFRLWFTDVKATLTDGTVVTPVPRLNLLESP